MRAIVTVFILSLFMASCQKDKGYYISGTINNVPDGTKVFVSEIKNSNTRPERIDSTEIKDGKFEIDLEDTKAPSLSFLEFPSLRGNVIYIAENNEIDFKVYKDSIRASEVNGGQENERLTEYLDHISQVNNRVKKGRGEMRMAFKAKDTARLEELQKNEGDIIEDDKTYKKERVTEHPDSFVSVMILTDMLSMNSYPIDELKEMYQSLSEDIKNTPLGKSLGENLENSKSVAVGSEAPSFSAPTPEGKELSLAEAMGKKVTIVDFWAAWCKPCRMENPNVVKVYNKYHNKGLNIIGVSLDKPGDKDKWLKAIKDDGLVWNQVSNLKFWQDPIAKKYDVRAIPASFILDENGKIVDRNLRGEDLENKVKEMIEGKN